MPSDARSALAEQHLWCVHSIAAGYRNRMPAGVELNDLVAEGTLGLYEAIERFDPSRGLTLATYATQWVRARVRLAIGRGRSAVTPPRNVRGCSEATKEAAESALRSVPLTAPMRADGDALTIEGTLAAECVSPLEALEARCESGKLARVLEGLTSRERAVLTGVANGELRREIAARLGISRTRVNQIEQGALVRARGMITSFEERGMLNG